MVVTLFGKDGGTWVPMSVQNPKANPDFQIDTLHWTMTPIIGKVSEATWHWNDPSNMPAAANTVPAVVGITIKGFCFFEGQSRGDSDREALRHGQQPAAAVCYGLHDDVSGSTRPIGASAVVLAELTASVGTNSTLADCCGDHDRRPGVLRDSAIEVGTAGVGQSAGGESRTAVQAGLHRRRWCR